MPRNGPKRWRSRKELLTWKLSLTMAFQVLRYPPTREKDTMPVEEDEKPDTEIKEASAPPHANESAATGSGPETSISNTSALPASAPSPSPALVGRCADVLSVLVKLWDARTAEWHANEAAGLHKRRQPLSKENLASNGQQHSSKESRSGQGEEEEDELASDNGDPSLPAKYQDSYMSHDGGPGSRSTIANSPSRPRHQHHPNPNNKSPFRSPFPPGSASAQLVGSSSLGSPQFTELLGGTPFNFDLASFWDETFFDPMFISNISANMDPAFAQTLAGSGGAYVD